MVTVEVPCVRVVFAGKEIVFVKGTELGAVSVPSPAESAAKVTGKKLERSSAVPDDGWVEVTRYLPELIGTLLVRSLPDRTVALVCVKSEGATRKKEVPELSFAARA